MGNQADSGQFVTLSFDTANTISADDIRIQFANDLYDPANNIDRNVRIDAIVIDGVRFETESSSVFSTGTWQSEDGIAPGFRNSEFLHSNGYFQFAATDNSGDTLITVRASGNEGGESFLLKRDGQVIGQGTVTTSMQTFQFSTGTTSIDQLEIEFTNDLYQAGAVDRNLRVDYVAIDGARFQTEADDVYSTGTWKAADGIAAGFRNSESLHTNGSLFFGQNDETVDPIDPDPPTTGNDALDRLNAVLPDGWNSQVFRDGNDIRIQTIDANGNLVTGGRFGSGGVIAQLQDSRNGNNYLAPSFQGETTDRVIQWTLWEQGQRAVHDVGSLPPFEDRFNITQAGNFDGALAGTVDVDLDSANGQLDVWSVADQQWKSQLQPHIQGTVSSLTRTTVLDGGAILVRRIIRVENVTVNGQSTTIENPYFESWNPFSDSTFNSLALGIDSAGNPNFWYADGQNIPNYPSLPVAQTRGWATVYNRDNLRGGGAVSVIFGRDQGTVNLVNGSQVDPRRFVLNSLDFEGGLAVLPGFWTGELPNGSIIDQSYIIMPQQGVQVGTAATLDALAAELPPPQVYHPGAQLDAELQEIADRLNGLKSETRVGTNQLGTLI